MTTPETETPPALWVLHGDNDGAPGIAAWARSEADAEAKLASLQAEQKQNTFWTETLDAERVAYYKENGLLPPDA